MEHSIADRRKALGLTQTELALASRLSRPQISAVETGRHTPNVKAALAIAEALGTTVEELFGESGASDRQLHVPALGKEPSGTVAVLAVRVGDVLTYHPLPNHGASESSWDRADGLFRDGRVALFDDADPSGFAVAGCDPALGLAASLLPGRGPSGSWRSPPPPPRPSRPSTRGGSMPPSSTGFPATSGGAPCPCAASSSPAGGSGS